MYGMLMESVQHFVCEKYGEEIWKEIAQLAGAQHVYITHQSYSDDLIPRMATAMAQAVGEADGMMADDYMRYFGACFVNFFSHYGYDRIVRVSGRYFRNFLIGIDNLHEHMRFGYPNLQSPVFYCDEETSSGLVLHYHSRRKGFKHYVVGQIEQIARSFYNIEPFKIKIVSEGYKNGETHVAYALYFDNNGFKRTSPNSLSPESKRYINSETFFEIVPFSFVICPDLTISVAGCGLVSTLGNRIIGCKANDVFEIRRPKADFTWQNVRISIW